MRIIVNTDEYNKPVDADVCVRQHVVDLDSAVFTCNIPFARNKPFIRGVVLQDYSLCGHGNIDFNFQFSRNEVLIEDLPPEDRAKVYGCFCEQDLCNTWRYILEHASGQLGWCRNYQEQMLFERNYFTRKDIPVMIPEYVPRQCLLDPETGKPRGVGGYSAPLLIQGKAVLAKNENGIITRYGLISRKSMSDPGFCTTEHKVEYLLYLRENSFGSVPA